MNFKQGDLVRFVNIKQGQQIFNQCSCNDTFKSDFRLMSEKVFTILDISKNGDITINSKSVGVSRNWTVSQNHVSLGLIFKHNPVALDEELFKL